MMRTHTLPKKWITIKRRHDLLMTSFLSSTIRIVKLILEFRNNLIWNNFWESDGELRQIRTADPLIRNQVLYPTELPVLHHIFVLSYSYRVRTTLIRSEACSYGCSL